jgi:hypothetical protein
MDILILAIIFGCFLLALFAFLVEFIESKYSEYLKQKNDNKENYYRPKI